MGFINVNSVFIVVIAVLVFLAMFCYDLGASADQIRPGAGAGMTGLALVAGLVTVFTAATITFTYNNKRKIKAKSTVKTRKPAKRKKHSKK